MAERYIRPDWFTSHILNPVVRLLTRLGISLYGSQMLAVCGRTSGKWRTTPVNVLTYQGARYLVSPRGATQWVRNLRASGQAELHLGRSSQPIQVAELDDDEKPAILKAYLQRWRFEVAEFFEDVGPDEADADFRRVAPNHPVFRIRV